MQVQSIRLSSQNYKNRNNISFSKKNISSTNDFRFSSISSNAIKSNIPITVAFRGKEITLQTLRQRELEINLEAIKMYYEAKSVYNVVAPQHLKEAKELYQLALDDISNARIDKKTHLEETIFDGKMVPHKMIKSDSFGVPLYSVDFEQGKIAQITAYDVTGKPSSLITYNVTSGDVSSYKKGVDNYDYLMEYAPKKDGVQTIKEYREGCKKISPDENYYKSIIEFVDATKLTSKKGVIEKDNMVETAIASIFEFEDDKTFKYQNRLEKFYHNSITRGEVINVKDRCITEWDTGFSDSPVGKKIQKARIILNENKIIEYDEGYEITATGRVHRGNYVHIKDGISHEILKALGFFN